MKKPALFLALYLGFLPFVLADGSSANYAISEDRFTGGGGSASSTNYQALETMVSTFSAEAMSSSNYAMEPKVGISSAVNLVEINSVSPATYSRHYHDETPSFTVTAVDPDSDTLQYQVKQDTTLKDGPQSSNELSWSLSSSDIGRHTLNFEVLDPDGTVIKQQPAYVYRRPVK